MPRLIRSHDLRTLFSGVGAIVVAGLMAGTYMHPKLVDLTIAGPQLQMGASGVRAVQAYDNAAAWISYRGQVPDYVIGTDALRLSQPRTEDDGIDERIDAIDDDARAPVMAYAASDYGADAVEPRADPETARQISYPSTSGGRAYPDTADRDLDEG